MGFFGGGGASVDLASPPAIGNTTPNTGAFTTLSANNGTITTSSPAFTLDQTWNAAGATFTALRVNATDTASASGSLLMDLQVGGSSRFNFSKNGALTCNANVKASYFETSTSSVVIDYSSGGVSLSSARQVGWANTTNAAFSQDVQLWRDAASVLALRTGTTAQTFRLYNTFTDASNYERGFMRWATNVLEIGTEAAGTGTTRNVVIKCGSTNILTINASSQTATFVARVSGDNFAIGGNFIYQDPISNGFRVVDGSGSTSASGGYFIYNSYTNTTNNERGFVRWGSNRFQVGTISIGTGTARSCEITFYTSASDPTSSDITSGYFSVWKNSGTGTIKLWANDGGTMKSVALA